MGNASSASVPTRNAESLKKDFFVPFFGSQRAIGSQSVNENGTGTIFDTNTVKMLKMQQKMGIKYTKFKKYSTPLNVTKHPVFKGMTGLMCNPAAGMSVGVIPGLAVDCIYYGSIEAANLAAQATGLTIGHLVASPLVVLGGAVGYLVWRGVKMLLVHHMILLSTEDNENHIFAEFHADGLACRFIDGDDLKSMRLENAQDYDEEEEIMKHLLGTMPFSKIDADSRCGFSLCPGKLATCLNELKERNYNVMNWNCQHFASMVGDLCVGMSVEEALENCNQKNERTDDKKLTAEEFPKLQAYLQQCSGALEKKRR